MMTTEQLAEAWERLECASTATWTERAARIRAHIVAQSEEIERLKAEVIRLNEHAGLANREVERLKAELARLTPSGQVAEELEAEASTLRHHVNHYDARLTEARNALRDAGVPDEDGEVPHHHALSIAQRVAMLAKERDDWQRKALERDLQVVTLTAERDAALASAQRWEESFHGLNNALTQRVLDLEKERDAAVADNAALREDRQHLRTAVGIYNSYIAGAPEEVQAHFNGITRVTAAAWRVYEKMLGETPDSHPGAAFLKEKQEHTELVRVLADALAEAEKAMAKCPAFNPWDLGPLKPLEDVRAALHKIGRLP